MLETPRIPTDSIVVDEARTRQTFRNIDELAESIASCGLICPLCVRDIGNGKYLLLAGERRLRALRKLSSYQDEVPVHIFDRDVDEFEIIQIEAEENLQREDMTPAEEVAIKKRLYDAYVAKFGEKGPGASQEGVSVRSMAAMLGESHGKLAGDLKLARAMEIFPELQECETKSDAHSRLKRLSEEVLLREHARRVEERIAATPEDEAKKLLADSFVVEDFFTYARRLRDAGARFDLVEIDPPYAIGLKEKKNKLLDRGHLDGYNEIDPENYVTFLRHTLQSCFEVMADNSWVIVWFSTRYWFPETMREIEQLFTITSIPGIWTKPAALANSPEVQMAAAYEQFFYARKGSPKLAKPGRLNVFPYRSLNDSEKIHPTERPIEMIQDVMSSFANPGATVLVPYAGSGNSLLAANNLGMSGVGCDLTAKYKEGYVARVVTGTLGGYRSY